MKSHRLNQLEYLFFVSATDAGGISAHTRKWALELHRRGRNVQVVCYLDIRTPYSVKVTSERFSPVRATFVEFDSLDKASVLGRTVVDAINTATEVVVLSPWMPKVSAIVNELRKRGHKTWHIEQAVGNDENGLKTLAQNWSTCDGVVAFGSRIENRIRQLPSYKQRPVSIFQSLPGSSVPADLRNSREAEFSPIRICYLGRLERVQKRVFDLVELLKNLQAMKAEYRLTVVRRRELSS